MLQEYLLRLSDHRLAIKGLAAVLTTAVCISLAVLHEADWKWLVVLAAPLLLLAIMDAACFMKQRAIAQKAQSLGDKAMSTAAVVNEFHAASSFQPAALLRGLVASSVLPFYVALGLISAGAVGVRDGFPWAAKDGACAGCGSAPGACGCGAKSGGGCGCGKKSVASAPTTPVPPLPQSVAARSMTRPPAPTAMPGNTATSRRVLPPNGAMPPGATMPPRPSGAPVIPSPAAGSPQPTSQPGATLPPQPNATSGPRLPPSRPAVSTPPRLPPSNPVAPPPAPIPAPSGSGAPATPPAGPALPTPPPSPSPESGAGAAPTSPQ